MRIPPARSARALLLALAILSCTDGPTGFRRPLTPVTPSFSGGVTPPSLVISQVYGGGGNSGATYKNDFIELFNPGTVPVSVNGWSVQYASALGTSWTVTNLTAVNISPGGYYLIQEAAGAGGTTNLPTPDATGAGTGIAMAAGAGKVFLSSSTTALSGACPTGANVIDKVSYGLNATTVSDCGFGVTGVTLTNTTAALRNLNGCAYTKVLSADFNSSGAAAPRNSANPTASCGPRVTLTPASANISAGTTQSFSAAEADISGSPITTTFAWTSSDNTIATVDANGVATSVAAGNVTIKATASDGVFGTASLTVGPPQPAAVTVTPATASINTGDTQAFTAAAVDASNNPVATTFTWTSSDNTVATVDASGLATSHTAGTATIKATAANSVFGTATLTVTTPAVSHSGEIVISQIYGGGGNGGATFKNDFIELFNRSTHAVDLASWSVQRTSATGGAWTVTALTGSIPSGSYYLVQEAAGTGGTTNLPAPDATGTLTLGATNGKVLVAQTTTAFTTACPSGLVIVDIASYGTGTDCGPSAPAPSNTTGDIRKHGGCAWTPNPSIDFTEAAPAPRNSASPPHSCVPGPLDHVVVTGSPLSILVGGTTQLSVEALDANDNPVPGAVITWSTSDATVATVNASGLVTGVASSVTPATITASAAAGGVTKTASLDVQVSNPGVINWIDATSFSGPTFPPGFQGQLFATARESQGGTPIPANFTFEAADGFTSVQTVQNTGIVTGVAAPTDGSRPGVRVTATPVAGGPSYSFVAHPFTIEAAAPAPTSIYATNDEFGDPSSASASKPNDFLIVRPQYTLSYNQSHGTPNWVSYELDSRQFASGADRCNCFAADPLLPPSAQILTSDYTSGGFDRGHMTRSADRTAGNVDNAATYYLTNVVPQIGDLNQGVWAQFENMLADSARAGRAVYVVTGPIYSPTHALTFVKNEGKLAIPDSTWKVALIGPANSGNPFTHTGVHAFDDLVGLSLLAVNMPNIAGVRNDPPSKYFTTVEAIEASTGFDLFSLLQASFTTALEHHDHAPVAHFTATAGSGASSFTFDGTTSTDPDIGRTDLGRTEALSYAWHFSDGTDATGSVVTHTFTGHGNLTATLTVTDAFGWPSSTSSTVTIANQPPTATIAAPATASEGTPFTVSLTNATDPSPDDAAHLQFAFDCGAGYGAASAAPSASCTAADQGEVTVKGKVIDPDGLFTEYSAAINVVNVAPTATLVAPPTGSEATAFTVSLTNATDPSPVDAASLTFAFDCGSGTYAAASSASSTSCLIADNGDVTVRAKVMDKDHGVSEYSALVHVLNTPPSATFTAPASSTEGSTISLSLTNPSDASAADVEAGFTFAFDCGAGFGAPGTLSTASCLVPDNGTQTVRGRVIDKDGGFTDYTAEVSVANLPPTATFSAPANGTEGTALTLSLTGATDPSAVDAASLTFAFDCGAGFSPASSASTATCTPPDNGSVTVHGKVIDKDGGSTEYAATVVVANAPPTAHFGFPATVPEGSAIALTMTSAADPSPVDVATLQFSFDCGSGYSTPSSTSTASCPTTDNGSRSVRAKVIDKDGAFAEYLGAVTITNVAPTATFGVPTANVTRGETIALSLTNVFDPSSADVAAGFTFAFDCGTGAGYGAATATATTSCLASQAGTRVVRAKVTDKNAGSTEYTASVTVVAEPTALVRHAPTLNASIDGSLQVFLGENVTMNGGSKITGGFYVPGLPTVRLNGNPSVGATVDAFGSASPSNYTVTLNGGVTVGTLVRRTDPGTIPTVAAPVPPAGTRTVSLNSPADQIGSWSTVRNLTLNGNVAPVTIPDGAYGDVTVNGSNSIVLGVAGATTPSVYHFQHMTLNGQAVVQVVGPVVVTVGNALSVNGPTVGAAGHPEWLTLKIAQGGLTLNSNVNLTGVVLVPNGLVTVNGGSTLTGGLAADGLTLNGNALVKVTSGASTP